MELGPSEPTAHSARITEREFTARRETLRERMRVRSLDAVMISGPENIYYLTGLNHHGYFAFTALIIGREGPPRIVARSMEEPTLSVQVPRCAMFTYRESDDPADKVADALRSAAATSVGVELQTMFLPPALWDRIRICAPMSYTDASGMVDELRRVKSPAEIACIREAARMSAAALRAGLATAGEGVSEQDIAAAVQSELTASGSEFPGIVPLIRSADTLPLEHVTWRDRRLRAGDTLFFELSGSCARYHAPISRMVHVGTAPPGAHAAMQIVTAGMKAIQSSLHPGARTGQIYHAWQTAIDTQRGRPARRRHHCGYMIGIGFPPSWSGGGTPVRIRPDGDLLIEPGMAFHVMSWLLGQPPADAGFSTTALVTDTGCEMLTDIPSDPITI